MELFFEVFMAAMAVFGLWCALRLLSEALLGSRSIGTVIEITDEKTAARLPELLEEVRNLPFGQRGKPLIVLYSADLSLQYGTPDARERELIAHFGGRWCVAGSPKNEVGDSDG